MNLCDHGRDWRALFVILACALLASCISVPTGTTQVYRKADNPASAPNAEGRQGFETTLFTNNIDPLLTVHKAGGDKASDDVFAIYLSDGYFKYLKDTGGVNEVIVVAEFTEVNDGTASDTVTRVLGPYFGVSDKAGTPFLNKLLYGPKTLESDHLNMKLTVLEYDQGENQNSAAFLDFIQSVTQTLSLANPVTAAEQVFAKEIAKSLLSLNKDDVVMEIDINFTGNTGQLANIKNNGSYIPLNIGDYVLINKEHCVPANCYGRMVAADSPYNPFAWIGDIVMLVPAAVRRGLADTPDGAALADVNTENLNYSNHQLTQHPKGAEPAPFVDKTWLALSIVKGGDASLWQKRKALTQAELAVQNMIKVRGGPLAFSQNYQTARQALEAAREAEVLNSSGVAFVSPLNATGDFAPTTTDGEYCVYHSRTVTEVSASVYRLDDKEVPQQVPANTVTKNTSKATPNNTCFDIGAAARVAGTYDMLARYKVGTKVLNQTIRYEIKK